MSIQAVAWALEQDLPARPKLVLVAIANHANHVDGYCWLKVATIAREAACQPRSVYNFVGALVRNGYIRKQLRKGDDGKQRATDYWILFDREEKPWDQDAQLGADEADGEASDSDLSPTDDTTSSEPMERHASGENAEPDACDDTRQPVEMSSGACGPVAPPCRRYSEEPSKTNPKASSASARVHDAALRAYRPPPPQPVGADPALPTKQVFVFDNTPAYQAWAKRMAIDHGLRSWNLTTRMLIDGQWRTGWYFPTLFPPETAPAATGPPIP